MESSRFPRPFSGVKQAIAAAALLVAVVVTARFCAFQTRVYLKQKADDAALWILQEQTITRGFGLQLIDNQLRYAASFGLGLTDAMIQFENIPLDPTGVFVSLWKGMNPGILVKKVEFLHQSVRVTLTGNSYQSLNQYYQSLLREDSFSEIHVDYRPGTPKGEVVLTCYFSMT